MVISVLSVLNPACKHQHTDGQTIYKQYIQYRLIKGFPTMKQTNAQSSGHPVD